MQNIFQAPQGGVVGVVVIPFDYEELPEDRRKTVVPICIETQDRDGNVIDPVWFERGVAPISTELTDLAQAVLGDRRLVSDIVQPTVHKVWYKHRHNAGDKPYARIWRQAIWETRRLAVGENVDSVLSAGRSRKWTGSSRIARLIPAITRCSITSGSFSGMWRPRSKKSVWRRWRKYTSC